MERKLQELSECYGEMNWRETSRGRWNHLISATLYPYRLGLYKESKMDINDLSRNVKLYYE